MVAYERALSEQRARREHIVAGGVEAFWLLTHPEVYTTGRRAVDALPSRAFLRSRNAQLVHTERGGLTTWHGPGQLVGYLLVDIGGRGIGTRSFVHAIEEGLITWLVRQGIAAGRRDGLHGVWVGERKIAAVGLHVRHGVTLHGFALNLDVDLTAFDGIVACGIVGAKSTSVAHELGCSVDVMSAVMPVGACVVSAIRALSVDTSGEGDKHDGVATMSRIGT